ncbi:MAG: glycine cleavage system aminomethyltransferase GcvT [Bradymonadaceae bacterium]|nr:glycine cleavage system aminomethyltransferase GcvT [Lujinxingiaceae bacterium]
MSQELRHIPLEDRHVALGAKMVPFAGYLMPVQYTGLIDEHQAVRTRAGLFDVSHMGEVEIVGKDAIAVIDGLVTNDATKLVDGQAMYTVMCKPDGGIVDDLIVYRLAEDHVFVCVNASNRDKDFAHMRQYARGEATLTDRGDAYGQFAIQGPDAQTLLQRIAGIDLSAIGAFRCQFGPIAGHVSLIARTGYTGEDGFEIYVPAEHAGAVFDALIEATSREELALCGLGCRDTLRLEARLNLYGQEMDEQTNPFEAGLAWVVKLDKSTPFIGQQALTELKAAGPGRRLRGLVVEGRGIIRHGHDIFVDDQKVGVVTSGTYSPTLEQSIGLGYIDVEHAERAKVEVEVRGRRIAAAVTKKAFYSRK